MEKEKKRRKLKRVHKALIAVGCILAAIGIVALGFYFHFLSAHGITVWRPSYEKVDLTPILQKESLTDEDYDVLYKQTGITRIGVNRELARGNSGKEKIKEIQDIYFEKHDVKFSQFAPYVCTDYVTGKVSAVTLEKGDILVTSSTHIAGFRVGHAGLTVDDYGDVLQATQIGSQSYLGDVEDFTSRCNFMILRPNPEKIPEDKLGEICDYAKTELQGKYYFAAAGVFSKKTDEDKVQCAQIIWCAFNRFGYDIDSDGGAVVTPQDIANSGYMELVQVFGFNPNSLWR